MNEILVLLILLVFSGIFSGSETALVALSVARAEALMATGRRGATALVYLKHNQTRMLITILIGNNVVNIAASAIATVVATEHLGTIGPGVAVGVLTFLILVFGEITPKSLATRFAERISLVVAAPIYGLMRLLKPLVWLFERLTKIIQSLTDTPADPTITEQELINLAEHGEEEGTIDTDERELIERIFILKDLKTADVMTPRGDVFMLDGRGELKQSLVAFIGHTFNRVPLHAGNPSEIKKILYLRDVTEALIEQNTHVTLLDIAHDPLFCHENQTIDELLTVLLKGKQHMAVVVDEHGDMQGVVTLEDLLEELVGEIYDESDKLPKMYTNVAKEGVLLKGGTELRVVEKYFGIELPGKPTDTISRWVLAHTNDIPKTDNRFELNGMEVTIHSATRSHIEQVRMRRLERNETP